MSDATRILESTERGDDQSTEELVRLLYDELRRVATSLMAHEKPGQTLQATALVHEAYLRLLGPDQPKWENRRHFIGAAAEAMRRILIEKARRKKRLKHGGEMERVDLDNINLQVAMPSDDLLAINEALDSLALADPRAAELVKLRFFVGLTQAQVAEILGVSRRTANSMWALARAWLYRAIDPEAGGPERTEPTKSTP